MSQLFATPRSGIKFLLSKRLVHSRVPGGPRPCARASQLDPSRREVLLASSLGASLTAGLQATQAPAQMASTLTKDPFEAVKKLVPPLSGERYKGQSGKVGVIGGCREYTGAPYFAAISALKAGADLSHVFCTLGAATVIKSYSPELIVHPYLREAYEVPESVDKVQGGHSQPLKDILHWLERFDVLVIGPGLGRDELVHGVVKEVMLEARQHQIPLVIDADGLHIIKNNPECVVGCTHVILTPNHNEFVRLANQFSVDLESGTPEDQVKELCRALKGPVVVRKGHSDLVSDGHTVLKCTAKGSERRAGGQGDVLSGTLATFTAWATTYFKEHAAEEDERLSPLVIAAYGACYTAREASAAAFKVKKRSMLAGDVIDHLGDAVQQLFDS